MDRLMAASDLAITKGTRQTSLELAALGTPSISLSHGLNRIDDIRVQHIASNSPLQAKEIDAGFLAATITKILHAPERLHAPEPKAGSMPEGRILAAQRLAWQVERIVNQPKTKISKG